MCDWPQLKYEAGSIRTKNNIPVGKWEQDIYIQCGKCYVCRQRKLREWVFRLRQESLKHSSSFFVTLTYDNEHVPISPKNFLTLKKSDVQLFIRYLRRKQKATIKYVAVGEYGTINHRPHYHLLLFGVQNPQSIYESWVKEMKPIGQVHIGQVTEQSIAYTLEYITVYEDKPPDWKDIQPTFRLQSTKLGANWLENGGRKFMEKNTPTCLLDGTYKLGIPKYYRDKVYTGDLQDEYRQELDKVIQKQKNDLAKLDDMEIERCKRARLNKLKTKKSKKS